MTAGTVGGTGSSISGGTHAHPLSNMVGLPNPQAALSVYGEMQFAMGSPGAPASVSHHPQSPRRPPPHHQS